MHCSFGLRRRAMPSCSYHIPSSSKAQLSLEALLLFAVFLSVLAIALAASSQVRTAAQQQMDEAFSLQAFNDFSSKLSQACNMGNGNVRVFSSKGGPVEIASGGNAIIFASRGIRHTANVSCTLDIQNTGPSETFRMENTGGTIEIS